MKKLLLIPALLAGTLLFSAQKLVEISPMIGYNIAEGNLNIKDNGYPLLGLEVQFNSPISTISPEFSILYADGVEYNSGQDTKIIRTAFGAVYTFDAISYITPFAKIGGGYERVSSQTTSMENGFFVDTGVGAKIPFSENFAFKLEALYMAKFSTLNSGFADSNLVFMAGLTLSFGDNTQKRFSFEDEISKQELAPETETVEEITPVVEAPVLFVNKNNKKKNIVQTNSDKLPQTTPLNVTFENNSDMIKDGSDNNIQEYADFLKRNTNYSAKIIGYSDNIGNPTYNKELSKKRALSVVYTLEAKGVKTRQLSVEGRGEANPIADNSTPKGRAKNRRIEIELTKY
jgi:OOP family OmpA-OmpF porin